MAELTETSDVTARMAAMAAEIEELKRRIEEGGGAAVENDDYEAFAKNLLAAEDTPEGRAERAKRFTNLSPHEAARVMQAMGDWSVAGEMLRRCTVSFTSDALTCGVLDPRTSARRSPTSPTWTAWCSSRCYARCRTRLSPG